MTIRAVLFDIGGVLLDWNPRHLYRTGPDRADRTDGMHRAMLRL